MNEIERSNDLLCAADGTAHSLKRQSASELSRHLAGLTDNEWALWRCVCLRGAGFPVNHALELAVPECAAVADQLIQAQDEVQRTRNEALNVLQHKLKQADTDQRAILTKILRTIKNVQPIQPLKIAGIDCEELEAFRSAYLLLCANQAAFPHIFNVATSQISRSIHKIARTDRFREAIIWQNRHAIHAGIDSLLRHAPETTYQNSKQRSNEALVANYVQRYFMKNDTIGFFGPVGYARLVPTGEPIAVQPDPDLLATRNVYFEGWCIDALADALARNKALLPWLAPRRMPHIYVDGTTLYLPFAKPLKLSRDHAAVLYRCDGERTARELARDISGDSSSGLTSEKEVYDILEHLCVTKRIMWALEVPPDGSSPERALRRLLDRNHDRDLRMASLNSLEKIEMARNAVAKAAGNPEQLDEAFANLEATFMSLTDTAPTRSDGKMYAARTLVYEDCRRNIEIEVGPDLVHVLSKPLSLLVISARWFTYQVAELYTDAFMDAYIELTEELNASTVDFAGFWLWVQSLLYDDEVCLVDAVVPAFQERWADILSISGEHNRIAYTSDELRPRVLEAFDAPRPGWRAACYHSPDVLIRATSPEAIQAGNYQLVLGEFHIAMNTLQIQAFLAQHPDSEKILRGAVLDVPEPRILPVLSKSSFPISRVRPALVSPKDFRLVYTADVCADPQAQVLPVGSLVVENCNGSLVVRTRDGQWNFDIIEVVAEFLSRIVVGCFKMFPPSNHRPRVTIDSLVVARESWCFAPTEIPFAQEMAAADRFVTARRWAQKYKMPRFVFVKVPTEQKPCFIDFDSPIFIDIFAKMVRKNMEINPNDLSVTIFEMLPEPDRVWLPDAEGNQYTSELRFVAVDQVRLPEDDNLS